MNCPHCAEWKQGLQDANKISQRFQAENEQLRFLLKKAKQWIKSDYDGVDRAHWPEILQKLEALDLLK